MFWKHGSMESDNGNGEAQEHKGYGKKMHGNQNQNGEQMHKNRPSLSLFQKLQNIGMFLGMLLSCTVITYWIAIPKKKKLQ